MWRLSKTQRRKLERASEPLFPLLVASVRLLILLPFPMLALVAKAISWIWWIAPSRRKRIAEANIRLALGSEAPRSYLREAMELLIRNFLEVAKFYYVSPEEFRERVEISGAEYLEEARRGGRGVVAVSCHLGNFPLLCMRLALEGWKVGVVAKMPRNRPLAKFLREKMAALGIRHIEGSQRHKAARESLRLLQEGGLLYLMIDQNPRRGGIPVPFFGRPVPTYRGASILAERSRAVLIPIFIASHGPGRHTVYVERPYRPSGDPLSDLEVAARVAEDYIRRFPTQWWWWHRRWRGYLEYR